LFVTRGYTLRLVDASRLPLRNAIVETIKLGYARLVYYAPHGFTFYLEVSRDGKAGCIAVRSRGMPLYGQQCLQELAKFLDAKQGTIEIIKLSDDRVRIDFQAAPSSIIPGGVAAVAQLVGLHSQQTGPPAAQATQTRQVRPMGPARVQQPATPQLRLATMHSPASSMYAAIVRRRGFEIGDIFNILAASAIALRGQEIGVRTAGRTCIDILDELLTVNARLYMMCRGEHGELHVYSDPSPRRIELLLISGEETLVGERALEGAARLQAEEVRVYVEQANFPRPR